ncbi:MAG: type ISP restriction/modification enzyme [bacterium]|nr:type ISP restriction/modification enzyme [bacterium]
MNILIEQTKQKIARIRDTATERSYYPILCGFFEEFAKSDAVKLRDTHATPEETTTQYEKKIGFPDITIRNRNDLIGWVEVKMPDERNLNADKFHDQFSKYKESLENIIFTNLREWQLWQWEDGEPKKTSEVVFDLTALNGTTSEQFEQFLVKFFEGHAYQARTPKQLALALAKKTRLLSKQVEEAIEMTDEKTDLWKLKETFEKTLIQDISSHQFANMVAETMAYSLFLSALEHEHRGNDTELTLTNAIDYLPTNVPILADLYGLIKKVASAIPNIAQSTQLLVDQLNASEIERIRQKLVEHKPGEDPVIQFYEPFLAEYDPKEREARGVYYTPKPVVDYIVRSVDWILRNKFGKEKGLADESVNLLDPATGTGTFLMSAIQQIYWNTKKENEALGDEMVSREFNKIVGNHILKHFYGFELLIAPYAIAHLKLTLEIEHLGFDFKLTASDDDSDNDRFKVYLANTLDDPNKPPQKLFGFDSIPHESEKAQTVKRDVPILVVLGNPPYSGISQNAVETTILETLKNGKTRKKKIKTWIGDLIEDYKYTDGNRITGRHFKERKHWLGDDYVKFIRFTQWKIEQHGEGVIGLITNNGFVDNPTFRGMRYHLINSFDQIYIYDLHGSAKRKEEDQNVFEQVAGVGTSIIFLIKKRGLEKKIFKAHLRGKRADKWERLATTDLQTTDWDEVKPSAPMYIFEDSQGGDEYGRLFGIEETVSNPKLKTTGVQTSRDNFAIAFSKNELINRFRSFTDLKSLDREVRDEFQLKDTRGWKLPKARRNLSTINWQSLIYSYDYNPFDRRYILWDINAVDWPRTKVMRHMTFPNLSLCVGRAGNAVGGAGWNLAFCSNAISDLNMFYRGGNVSIPLYLYPESTNPSLLKREERLSNFSKTLIGDLQENLGLTFVHEGRGDIVKTFGPEDIFYYTYAVFHSPTYRTRYAEQLKIDFPRLPITSNKEIFKRLVALGNELVNLHLLGENPFDASKTILDEPNKWNVKIDGTAPANLDDWKVTEARYEGKELRVYVNQGQYFEGIEKEVWEFMIGGYQVCEKWLKDRKKAERTLSTDDLKHYMKIVVSLRETIRIMGEIDKAIPTWPIK